MSNCRKCGHHIPPSALQELSGISHCPACDVVFAYSREDPEGSAEMPRVPLPRAITVYDSDSPAAVPASATAAYRQRWQPVLMPNEFRIVRRWFRWSHLTAFVLSIFWNGTCLLWFWVTPHATMFILIPLAVAAIGLLQAYKALYGLLNRTTIRAHAGLLEVTHGPIPVRGNTKLPIASIEQIYGERKATDSNGYGGPIITYNLCVRTKSGLTTVLIANLPEANQALYLQQAIESRLGLTPGSVLAPANGNASG